MGFGCISWSCDFTSVSTDVFWGWNKYVCYPTGFLHVQFLRCFDRSPKTKPKKIQKRKSYLKHRHNVLHANLFEMHFMTTFYFLVEIHTGRSGFLAWLKYRCGAILWPISTLHFPAEIQRNILRDHMWPTRLFRDKSNVSLGFYFLCASLKTFLTCHHILVALALASLFCPVTFFFWEERVHENGNTKSPGYQTGCFVVIQFPHGEWVF